MAWRASLLPGVLALSGCVHHAQRAAAPSPDQSFYNVKADDRLRIVMPLVKNNGSLPHYSGPAVQGNTITLSANDLLGFETAHYEAVAQRGGRIQLRFTSAEQTKTGKQLLQIQRRAYPSGFRPPRFICGWSTLFARARLITIWPFWEQSK